ncbi:hypothetical protein EBZ39_16575 [bacterium]|nr:hypothetical protein [bacterium]
MNTELQNCVEKMKETDTEITNRLVKIRQGFHNQNEIIDSIAEELEMCFNPKRKGKKKRKRHPKRNQNPKVRNQNGSREQKK